MGALVSPPVYPSLPASTVLQLQADIGATVGGGQLTQWGDQSSNGFTFIRGRLSRRLQQRPRSSKRIRVLVRRSDVRARGRGRERVDDGTSAHADSGVLNTDIGAGVATLLSQGTVSQASAFISGEGTYYGNGVTNDSGSQFYSGTPYVITWELTPNGTLNASLTVNGWPLQKQQVAANIAGAPAADTGNTTLELWHDRLNAGAFYFDGDIEEVIGWATPLGQRPRQRDRIRGRALRPDGRRGLDLRRASDSPARHGV